MSCNDNLIAAWRRRNQFPLSAPATPDDRLKFLHEDLDRAITDLVTDVTSAANSLDAFDPDVVNDIEALQMLHSDVQATIKSAAKEGYYQVAQAWRRFKEAKARDRLP